MINEEIIEGFPVEKSLRDQFVEDVLESLPLTNLEIEELFEDLLSDDSYVYI